MSNKIKGRDRAKCPKKEKRRYHGIGNVFVSLINLIKFYLEKSVCFSLVDDDILVRLA